MLGRAVVRQWRGHGVAVLALSHGQADITDRDRLLEWARRFHPELVVNCAAFTRVDDCETEVEHATAVNGAALEHVVAAADSVGADLVHVSTDYVFDGEGREPYREDGATGPRSVYGRSKLAGEQRALGYERALVVRASWLFGSRRPQLRHPPCAGWWGLRASPCASSATRWVVRPTPRFWPGRFGT